VAATTARSLAITITQRMIAVNSRASLSSLSQPSLNLVKDALVVTMEREDAAVLTIPVMKERETVMVQEMVDNMMVIPAVKVI